MRDLDSEFGLVGINKYLEHIKASYRQLRTGPHPIREEMEREINDALTVSAGRKYLKVIIGPQSSSHSFIVLVGDNKFKRGDVLMAASWNAPARNFARANLADGNYMNISWTGA